MSTGARSQPPDLPNFSYKSWLGGGGFADVFLYDQLRPRRQVAVKVLLTAPLDAADQRTFDAEANLMAKVSAHPYIVTIFGADVAPDGRPFLVMEYYPKDNFRQRARGNGLAVQEVLKVGIRVASAVETAHRAGILHRDIKPANILVSEYDRPGLTDFGIAGAREDSSFAEVQGITVMYAAAEVLFKDNPGDESSDVYSLGATLYALLAGRAPFEVARGDNSEQAIVQRTLSAKLPPIGREDVPRSLELLLEQAMSKDPSHRPDSASAFARALQGIERELQLATTEFELAGVDVPPVREPAVDDEDGTRAKRIQVVRPAAPASPIAAVPHDLTQGRGPTVERAVDPAMSVPSPPPASETVIKQRTTAPPAVPPPSDAPRSDHRRVVAALAGGVAVLAIVGGVIASAGGGGEKDPTTTTTPDDAALVVPDVPDVPTDVAVVLDGGVAHVGWNPGTAKPGDEYQVQRTDGAHGQDPSVRVSSPSAQFEGVAPGDVPCFEVEAIRGARFSEPSAEACAAP